MKALHKIAFILVIIGGLNWLAFGVSGYEVGSLLGGMSSVISKVVYIIVGVSTIVLIATHKASCKDCDSSAGSM